MTLRGCVLVFVLLPVAAASAEEPAAVAASTSHLTHAATQGMPAEDAPAGEIFGTPVSIGNYAFAKRVAYMFPRPWGAADLPEAEREDVVWESLILHYESYRRSIQPTEEQLTKAISEVLSSQQQTFTRQSDPAAYTKWVTESLQEPIDMFENQIRYLWSIRTLQERILEEQQVTVSDEEMQREFLNEQHHVGGEMVTFPTLAEAQAFYEQHREPAQWDAMKAAGQQQVRPVSLMTLEAYTDLWGVSQAQIEAFHALELGSIGAPMAFGNEWCVYRLLDKRTGELKDFPERRDSYRKQVELKKKYEARKRWIERFKQSANLKVLVTP